MSFHAWLNVEKKEKKIIVKGKLLNIAKNVGK